MYVYFVFRILRKNIFVVALLIYPFGKHFQIPAVFECQLNKCGRFND